MHRNESRKSKWDKIVSLEYYQFIPLCTSVCVLPSYQSVPESTNKWQCSVVPSSNLWSILQEGILEACDELNPICGCPSIDRTWRDVKRPIDETVLYTISKNHSCVALTADRNKSVVSNTPVCENAPRSGNLNVAVYDDVSKLSLKV